MGDNRQEKLAEARKRMAADKGPDEVPNPDGEETPSDSELESEAGDETPDEVIEEEVEDEDEPLREPGKKALQAEREAREAAEAKVNTVLAGLSDLVTALNGGKPKAPTGAPSGAQVDADSLRHEVELEKLVLHNSEGADAGRLLNHVGFLKDLHKIKDSSDSEAVQKLVKEYADKFDYLKKQPTKRVARVNSSAGQEQTAPTTREQKLAAARARIHAG